MIKTSVMKCIKSLLIKTLAARSIFLVSSILFSCMSYGKVINIISLGVKPDSISNNTAIIQSAIDQCHLAGGGRVLVPPGKYITGSLNLKSNVELHLESGAVIIGNSEVWQLGDNAEGRPKIIYFVDCQDVLVEGITLTNSAFWVSDYRGCNYVKINNVKIYSYGNHNNDGIDIDSRNVVVSDCIVETDDDALCFKSHTHDRPCENVAVTNCVLASNCNAIKFGTASHGGFRNISVTNCVIKRPVEDQIRQWHKHIEGIDSGHTVISGIALESVDGGIIDQVKISDIIMDGVQTPIFIKLGDRRRYNKVPGQLKNVQINNIVARNASLVSSSITGFPGHYIENVSISNVKITYQGGGTRKHYEFEPPENEKGYPENRMFGHYLLSYGFFIRHVKNLLLNNILLSLAEPDYRSVIRMNDVEDIKISGI